MRRADVYRVDLRHGVLCDGDAVRALGSADDERLWRRRLGVPSMQWLVFGGHVPVSLERYYAARAAEYERIYFKPERQADLRALEAWLPGWFAGRRGLEVACGTGWWSGLAARDATQWLATDFNEEVLAIARTKPLPHERVRFAQADAYTLDGARGPFDAALAAFWWSHVPLERASEWLKTLHGALEPGAVVVLIDNRYVEGSSTPISRTDAVGNTWQTRALDDGSTHEVLKNFPAEEQLRALLEPRAVSVQWHEWRYFWACTWRTRDASPARGERLVER